MFEIFKKDIKIGDKVRLYLTTGKEPQGTVLEIGYNFVLIESEDKIQNRFFDKLIGGWDLISPGIKSTDLKTNTQELNNSIDKDALLKNINQLKLSLDANTLNKIIEPNANIIEVRPTTCVASNNLHSRITIINNKIPDDKLLSQIGTYQRGSTIPVVLSLYIKHGEVIVNSAVLPGDLNSYFNSFIEFTENNFFNKARLFFCIIKNYIPFNKIAGLINNELKKTYNLKQSKEPKKIQPTDIPIYPEKRAFKNVEKEINDLIRQSKFEFALNQINSELLKNQIDPRYKSSLLLKKAQMYSSMNKPDESEAAYQELVIFNERIKTPPNNLSHLYTELARLQALNIEKQSLARESVKKALMYNPNNIYANNLLKQFESRTTRHTPEVEQENDEHLLIEVEDDSSAISKMIDIDIKEHKFSHPEIIKNGGNPTAFIAGQIFNEAKGTRDTDLSERFPIYLEAAKAFSELNIGSYDLQDYLQSIAYYSMLKGNSLFINFRNRINNNDLDIQILTRLKDSACSYYIESLNLLSNIEPKFLLSILANYLKLNLALYHVEKSSIGALKLVFKGQFADVFKECVESNDEEISSIAFMVIVDCGSYSINVWNKLVQNIPVRKIRLNDIFSNKKNQKILNSIINEKIPFSNKANLFLSEVFNIRKKSLNNLSNFISKIQMIEFIPTNFKELKKEFHQIDQYKYLLLKTDLNITYEIENILGVLEPYLNRAQNERTNILIQSRRLIEDLIAFINRNTTYFGRTLFYPSIIIWKSEVEDLLEAKIAQSYPQLSVIIDPPYFIKTENDHIVPFIIKNEGEATAQGFSLKIVCESTEYEEFEEIPFESHDEVSAGGKKEMNFKIPSKLLEESKAVEISIEISAVYQKKTLPIKRFEFTIEEEPKSTLTYEDIPWRDGPIPPEHLFKGRKQLILDLAQHYLSVEKDKPYILYGLTRTGKSSILEYLKRDIDGSTFISKDIEYTVLTFSWDLSEAASYKKASDFWEYILYQQTFQELIKYSRKYDFNISSLSVKENVRAKDLKVILDYINSIHYYPFFLIDEFSFIRSLIDDGTVNSAFLHTLRQFSLKSLASFIFAGTYDIKSLIKDPKYGITGQLVNAIEEQVNEINDDAAEELIEVINDKLTFTPEAIHHIKFLTGNVPYFIQIICKFCGFYASEYNRRYIGYPELESVIKILIGQEISSPKSLVKKLPENTFQNNQFSPTDPKEVPVLISSIVFFNKDRINDPRGVGFDELQKLWADKNIGAFRPKLAEAIDTLKEKKILLQEEDEGIPIYKLSVDLFRRWWANHHPDFDLMITTIVE